MAWNKIASTPAAQGRPVMVRTLETDDPVIAFVTAEGIWYEGGALVQTAGTVLGATPTEWCEPMGDASL